jgi:hypothetical protein
MDTEIKTPFSELLTMHNLCKNVTKVECDVVKQYEYSCLWTSSHDLLIIIKLKMPFHNILTCNFHGKHDQKSPFSWYMTAYSAVTKNIHQTEVLNYMLL